jgi:hypothetical protein
VRISLGGGGAIARTALLALTAAAAFGLAACSSAGSAGYGGATGPSAAQSSAAVPSWAAGLGTGVTVTAPSSVQPGNGSPAAAVSGEINALNTKKFADLCPYQLPDVQGNCKAAAGSVPTDKLPYATNPQLGYVAISGTKALVGMTGKFCSPGQSPECYSNSDPAAIFSAGKSFDDLWTQTVKNSSSTSYSLVPVEQIGGNWYVYTNPS